MKRKGARGGEERNIAKSVCFVVKPKRVRGPLLWLVAKGEADFIERFHRFEFSWERRDFFLRLQLLSPPRSASIRVFLFAAEPYTPHAVKKG